MVMISWIAPHFHLSWILLTLADPAPASMMVIMNSRQQHQDHQMEITTPQVRLTTIQTLFNPQLVPATKHQAPIFSTLKFRSQALSTTFKPLQICLQPTCTKEGVLIHIQTSQTLPLVTMTKPF